MSTDSRPIGLNGVLQSYNGVRVAIDTACRSYTGRLHYYGEMLCVQEDDRTIAWVKTDTVSGCRVFPEGPKPQWMNGEV